MAATTATAPPRSEGSVGPYTPTPATPVMLDLGKHSRKRIKDLRRGKGRLIDEVNASIEELRTAGALAADAQPVIVIVRQKRRRMRGLGGLLPG